MTEDSKWVGTFEGTGFRYRNETPGSTEITKTPFDLKLVISVFDKTVFGTILKLEWYIDGKLVSTDLGHIKVIRNCCGKIITKCLEFVDDDDNAVFQYYVVKRDKDGFVQEYSISYIEAGFSATNPEQKPTILLLEAKRV